MMLFWDCRVLRVVAGTGLRASDSMAMCPPFELLEERNGCFRQLISAVRGDFMRPHLATNRADCGNNDQVISGISFT
jgi:hypothetical protein